MKGFRKLVVLGLISTVVLSACSTKGDEQQTQEPVSSTTPNEKIQFPLKESVTISVLHFNPTFDSEQFQKRVAVQDMFKETNIKLEYHISNAASAADRETFLKLALASGNYYDIILGVPDNVLSMYAASGAILPLEKYINDDITPNYMKAVKLRPQLKKVATDPSGHVYSMPIMIEVYQQWMENNFIINKSWLSKLGLKEPKTTDELYTVLKAFKEQDPNGNGIADEIPLTLIDEEAFAHLEAFMGSFGLAYKHGLNDGYTIIDNGKVEFAPIRPEYKEGIKFLRKLYTEGLLDKEVFTQKQANLSAKYQNAEDIVGSTVHKNTTSFKNPSHYSVIAPPAAPGRTPKVWVNPGVLGKRSSVVITKNNKYPEHTMALMDKYYNTQEFLKLNYSPLAYMDNGILKYKDLPAGAVYAAYGQENFFGGSWPGMVLEEDIGTKALVPPDTVQGTEYIPINKPYFAKDIWPRPQFTTEETEKLIQLRTDIFTFVKNMKAKFITDPKTNIDAEWDNYINSLKKMKLNEFLDIMQAAYDRYNAVK
ncbi:extracellular solute-binding protein [Paenibacillus koleovorans]|uniref:extracellular solute-binding protein n=1 Tax=Paenibacillus koleovorans TaxID=121608 RepID=UPI0013E317B5|nr:extracellular solute-binding protein [Paenibacillus koleovorans]